MSLVSFVKIQESTIDSIKETISKSLDLIEFTFDKGIKNVVMKPNLCYYWDYSTGQTTDPRVIATLIDLIRERISPYVNISIIESDASAMRCKYAFKFLGYEKIAEQHHVKLVNLSEVEAEPVNLKVNDQSFDFMIPMVIKDADLRISVPKMKYMETSKISCALKNIYGCNPYRKKFEYHSRLSETIAALNKIMQFDLCILDGIIVSGSQPSKLGLVMTSRDPVAMDTAAATIMGVNPKSVEHIVLAEKEGLGETSLTAKGMDLSYFKNRYPKRNVTDKAITLGFKMVRALGLEKRLML